MRSAACTVQSSSRAATCRPGCAMGGEYPRSPMRHLLGVVGAVAAAVFGGLVLGEYELKGAMVVVAAALFGVAVAEVLVAVSRQSGLAHAGLAGVVTGLGFAWSSWIQAGRDWGFVTGLRWAGVPIGAVAAALWVRSSGRRAAGSPAGP